MRGVVEEGDRGKKAREAEGTFWEDAVKGIHSKTEETVNIAAS